MHPLTYRGGTAGPGRHGRRRVAGRLLVLLAVVTLASACFQAGGAFDSAVEVTGAGGAVWVTGWAYDRDAPDQPISVHVYVDDAPTIATVANLPRPDVAAAVPGASPTTGYAVRVPAVAGTHRVCVYAIDQAGGDANALIGCRTVGVAAGGVPAGRTAEVAYGPDPEQTLDVYRPNATGSRPVILWIHGGGWVAGDKGEVPSTFLGYYQRGEAVVVSVNYRLSLNGKVRFPVALGDVKRAVRWIKSRAGDLGADAGRIIVAGGSAGGNLAAMAGATAGTFEPTGLPAELAGLTSDVQGVVSLSGITDFHTFWQAGGWAPDLQAEYLGCPKGVVPVCTWEQQEQASVAPYLDAGDPPAFIAAGELDGLAVPATQGAPVAARWSEVRAGKGVVYRVQAGAGHNVDAGADPAFAPWMATALAGSV